MSAWSRSQAAPSGSALSSVEAAAQLRLHGRNELPTPRRTPAWKRLAAEFVHFFALMLWVAGVLACVAGMPQLGVAIFVVVVINGLFAFAQAERAERATERLRSLMPTRVTVRRDGVPAVVEGADVVMGDVVLLQPRRSRRRRPRPRRCPFCDDRRVHADRRERAGRGAQGRPSMGGDVRRHGGADGVVVGTGAATRLAGIATLTAGVRRPPSPLAGELHRVVRTIAVVALGVGVAFFGLSLALGTEPRDGFLFAVGVTVALVPEGLLPTVTLSLAMGAQRMAARNALVRNLEAVETLGSTTFICTDKTGTLTRNEMTVAEVWTPAGPVKIDGTGYGPVAVVEASTTAMRAAREIADAAVLCSLGRVVEHDGQWQPIGDPMEAALHAFQLRLGGDAGSGPVDSPQRFPFDTSRRRASLIVGKWLLVKGASDAVLPRCASPSVLLDDATRAGDAMAGRGLRVLAVARRPAEEVRVDDDADRAEQGLELLGLVGLQDPPRTEVAGAIADCRRAGIRLAMVTGDHPSTARAIAQQVGLIGIDGLVLQGSDLPADDDALGALLDRDGVVVSRVTPEHKLRIAHCPPAPRPCRRHDR